MPCPHKFQKYLNLENLDFKPETLMVGTFNPSWPEGNPAEWFYGRTKNNYLWDVLPRLHEPQLNLRSGNHHQWKAFCAQYKIALTDAIYCINEANEANEEHQDILSTYLDGAIADYFDDFTFTDILKLLDANQSIQNVYLTRQDGIELFDEQWALIEQYSSNHPDRNLHLRKLLTPSASARFQIAPYKAAHPNDSTPLRNFIFQSWKEQWHN